MITRDSAAVAREEYDLIAVGGGIYGACLALEASRRGLKALVLERDDFGGCTTWNSLRIVHGGLRYLQSLDLVRFRESVLERRWFLRAFPDLVRPLRCLMPLYGRGLKRPEVIRVALAMNDLLSADRNREVQPQCRLPAGAVLSVADTVRDFPAVRQAGLRGAGAWFDAVMSSPQRVMMELLRWAAANGATAVNYVEAEGVTLAKGRVSGVRGTDRLSGARLEFRAPVVINCAGPWSREFTSRSGGERKELFAASLAVNVWLDVQPASGAALAVAPAGRGEPVYFMYPYRGRLMAGTVHAPWTGRVGQSSASSELIGAFLRDLNSAIPGLGASEERVVRVFAGFLPTTHEGGNKLTKRPVIIDHGMDGGPEGLISVSGIKLTTARRVADQLLRRAERRGLLPRRQVRELADRPKAYGVDLVEPGQVLRDGLDLLRPELERLVREEAVCSLADLVLRRTGWGDEPALEEQVSRRLAFLFPGCTATRGLSHPITNRP